MVAPPARIQNVGSSQARSERPRQAWRAAYPSGHLAVGRIKGMRPLKEAELRKLAAILDRALALAVRGKLYLFRKRNGDGACLCWAAARVPARPRKDIPVLSPID